MAKYVHPNTVSLLKIKDKSFSVHAMHETINTK